MSAWLLLMVLLSSVPGLQNSTVLNRFDTATAEADCAIERNRIGFEMAESYPYERDFMIVCDIEKPKIVLMATTRSEYEEIIKDFAKTKYPKQALTIQVMNIQDLRNESGIIPITAIQVNIFPKDQNGGESFFLLVKDKAVLGWIDAGGVEKEEEEEVFQNQDQT